MDPAERFATAVEMRDALDAPDLLWDVCPYGRGDVLGGHRIEKAGRRLNGVEPTVWELEARDASGTECFVAVGAEGPAGDWVRASAKRLPAPCHSEGRFVFAVVPKGSRQKASDPDRGTLIGVGGLLLGAAGLLAGAGMAAAATAAAVTTAQRNAAGKPARPVDASPTSPPSHPKGAPSATPPPAPRPKPSGMALLGQVLARGALRSAVGPLAKTVEDAAKAKKGDPPKK